MAGRYVNIAGDPVAIGGGGEPMIEALPTPDWDWPASATKIVIPDGVTGGISADAFYGCYNLAELVLPSGMTGSIGDGAFNACYNLAELVLPSGMTGDIGHGAFNECSSLLKLVLQSPTRMNLSNVNAFTNCPANIYVPDALVDGYKAATNWSTFAARIFPISDLP